MKHVTISCDGCGKPLANNHGTPYVELKPSTDSKEPSFHFCADWRAGGHARGGCYEEFKRRYQP